MPDSSRKLVIIILACILIVSGTGCSQARSTVSLGKTTVAVERGNLDVTISVDGNLNMPEISDLHFGAAGNVKEVNVKAGDTVKAGMIMATLDDTSEALDSPASQLVHLFPCLRAKRKSEILDSPQAVPPILVSSQSSLHL